MANSSRHNWARASCQTHRDGCGDTGRREDRPAVNQVRSPRHGHTVSLPVMTMSILRCP
jgi:hypothetical protein